MQPLVTVMSTCFNHAEYLDDYFQSLLAQTWPNIELIFFDDHSADASWDVVLRYEPQLREAFARVKCVRNETNLGYNLTNAAMLKHVRGEFLCLLDSDDVYYPVKVEENVGFLLARPEMGAVHSGVDMLLPDGSVRRRVWEATGGRIPQGWVYEDLLRGNFVSSCAVCFRTELFVKHVDFVAYHQRGYLAGDYSMNLDVAQHTQWGYIDEALACYRIRKNSASHFKDRGKTFAFRKSAGRVQQDYLQKYGASPETVNFVMKLHHGVLYFEGFALGLKEDCLEGYDWLVVNGYDIYERFYDSIIGFVPGRCATGSHGCW